jgi:hypothetical protein
VGRRDVEGKPAVALHVTGAKGEEHVEYYDVASGLLVAAGRAGPDGQPDMTGLPVFSDYKRFGAVLLATTLTVKLKEDWSMVTRTTHVDHGPIDTMLFVRPPEVRALLSGKSPSLP